MTISSSDDTDIESDEAVQRCIEESLCVHNDINERYANNAWFNNVSLPEVLIANDMYNWSSSFVPF